MIQEKLEEVRRRIAAAARSAGRNSDEVRLICVTKGVSVERIQEAVAAGATDLGENRVQEAQEKQAGLGEGLKWHLIGRLQRNKAKLAVELFDAVHSVDSLELAEALEKAFALRQSLPPTRSGAQDERPSRRAQGERKLLEVLLQVNVSGEAAKGGCRPEEAGALAEALLGCRHLRWMGLMTMAPFSDDPEAARPFFRQLRELRDKLEKRFEDCFVSPSGPPRNDTRLRLGLSMGMSQDFEVAVQEGATLVRIGTAIFGGNA